MDSLPRSCMPAAPAEDTLSIMCNFNDVMAVLSVYGNMCRHVRFCRGVIHRR